jgi:hypothetical protein
MVVRLPRSSPTHQCHAGNLSGKEKRAAVHRATTVIARWQKSCGMAAFIGYEGSAVVVDDSGVLLQP